MAGGIWLDRHNVCSPVSGTRLKPAAQARFRTSESSEATLLSRCAQLLLKSLIANIPACSEKHFTKTTAFPNASSRL